VVLNAELKSMNKSPTETEGPRPRVRVAAPHPLGSSTPERHKAAASVHCSALNGGNHIIKFPDDTTFGLPHGDEVAQLRRWCKDNSHAQRKTKELIVDFKGHRGTHSPISLDRTPVEIVTSVSWGYRSLTT